jgi:Zn-dependent M28 family amino/carboxypeptidase
VWLIVVAVLRAKGHHSTPISVAQFVPTVLLILAFAALFELATAGYSPAANDNGSGTATAIALVRALDAAPPRHMQVDLVLQGAGNGGAIGLRRHLRRHKRDLNRTNSAVIAFAASGSGAPRWWTSDGSLLPLRYSRRLRQLCAQIATDGTALPYRGRGTTAAFPARAAGIPAVTLGCLDDSSQAPRSRQSSDVAAALDPAALDATLEFALILVDAVDSFLAETQSAARRQTARQTETVARTTEP